MKKVLVTGADGFIGSHLVEHLVEKNYQVRALAQYNSFNNWGWLDNSSVTSKIEVITGDIRDLSVCSSICKDIDIVFHLAALIAIPYSYQAPTSYIDTNITGTVNMCLAARERGVAKFIHTSTSEVYGTAIYTPIDEKHPLQPQSPYSASKISADNMALSFYNSFNLPVVIARPFNTYGPRQSARAVIPTIITQILSGSKKIRLGAISPVRDFNYVADTCTGFLAVCEESAKLGEVYNIGSGTGVTIEKTFLLIRELMNADVELEHDEIRVRPEKSEVHELICESAKLRNATAYTPHFSLKDGLAKTIDWFKKTDNLAKYKTHIYNV